MASPRTGRTVDRIRALSKADLPAPLVVLLQICAIGRALETAVRPAFLTLASREVPEADFSVWMGSETITGELRMLIAADIWPGPEDIPSPSRILRDPSVDRFVSVTLYGEGAEGSWSSLGASGASGTASTGRSSRPRDASGSCSPTAATMRSLSRQPTSPS